MKTKKNILFFLMSTMLTFGFLTFVFTTSKNAEGTVVKNYTLSQAQVDSVSQSLPIDLRLNLGDSDLTPTNIVKYILSLLGGLLTSIILFFLHKWFPNIFTSRKVKDYIPRSDLNRNKF